MKLLVLGVLVYVAATLAQPLIESASLGVVGSKVGGRVGSGIGLGVGSALETVPKVFGVRPPPPVGPAGPRDTGYYRGGEAGRRDNERASSSAGGRGYDRRGSGGEYAKGDNYSRERKLTERERGSHYNVGRGGEGSERGWSGGRTNDYGRDRADFSRNYDEGFAPGRRY